MNKTSKNVVTEIVGTVEREREREREYLFSYRKNLLIYNFGKFYIIKKYLNRIYIVKKKGHPLLI